MRADKVSKNYYRSELSALAEKIGGSPLIYTGRYKYRENSEWVTFTTIRRFTLRNDRSSAKKPPTLCDHINIHRSEISKYLDLFDVHHNRKFYLCATICRYAYRGASRACLQLAKTGGESPLWMTETENGNELRAQRVLFSAEKQLQPALWLAPPRPIRN